MTAFPSDHADPNRKRQIVVAFKTRLGWMAMAAGGGTVESLSFGQTTAEEARKALESQNDDFVVADFVVFDDAPDYCAEKSPPKLDSRMRRLVEMLRAYAAGRRVDFGDVALNMSKMSDFARRVTGACRRIAYGQTLSYGELATRAGNPAAARAVGQCMAANRVPIIVPCHRVVPGNVIDSDAANAPCAAANAPLQGGFAGFSPRASFIDNAKLNKKSAITALGGYSAPGGVVMKRRLLEMEWHGLHGG